MATSKQASKLQDLNEFKNKMPSNVSLKKVMPPIQVKQRQPKKLLMTDSLVAPVEKTDVPNHVLDTSK